MTDLLPTFPPHPHTARIHTAHIRSTPSEEFRPYEETQYIICYLRPKFSQEEQSMSNRRRFGIGRTERLWIMPGFGDVNFVDPTTPWFLAGREIESIFCE
ncbi:MAG: hypothetical protein M1834_008718 [Cirrosporium novae-zelandiae]|nr:MAG: hypothetical protein M1834_008718 [Cirrosporium novae-zelandiae]